MKKLLSIVLALVMVIGLVPMSALAAASTEVVEDYLWSTYNIASSGTVSSNATYDETKYPVANLNNGGTGGFWAMSAPPEGEEAYVDVDFAEAKTIRAMRVALRNDGTSPVCKPNTIEYSYLNVEGEFVSMGKVATADATAIIAGELVLDEDIQTQKVRLTFPDGDTGSGIGLAEIYIADPTGRIVQNHHWPSVSFMAGATNGATVDAANWAVTQWVEGVSDTIRVVVTDVNDNVSTIKINGEAYTSGSDYKITEAGDLEVVINTARANWFDYVQKHTIKVGEGIKATAVQSPEVVEDYLWNTADYNVAGAATVSSNATYDDTKYPVSQLNNGGTGGFWVMGTAPEGEEAYVDVDFAQAKTIRAMRVALRGNPPVCIPNTIEYSYLNAEGEMVSLGKVLTMGSTSQLAGALVLPEDIQTTKVRLTFPDGDDGSGVGLAEIYILDPTSRTVNGSDRLPTIALASGSENGATVDGWAVTSWSGDANKIKIDFADVNEGNVSTVTVDGKPYTSGSDITIKEAGEIEVVVRTARANWFDKVQKFAITVSEPTVTELPDAELTLKTGNTMGALVDASTWTVTRWIENVANRIRVTVGVDDEEAEATATINGEEYIPGSEYTITQAGDLNLVVTTKKDGCEDKVQEVTIKVGDAYVVPAPLSPEAVEDYLWGAHNVAGAATLSSNATYSENYPLSNLNNGGTGGFWVMSVPEGEEAYVELDFGSARQIRAMRVALRNDGTNPVCIPVTIEYSYLNENNEFVSLGQANVLGATTIIAGQLVLPEDVVTSKLRLTFPDGDTGSGIGLSEIYVLDSTDRVVQNHNWPTIALASGSTNGATVDGWNVTRWTETENTIKIDFADSEGNASTVTVDGKDYTSGSDIVITEPGDIEVVVRTARANWFDSVQKFTITVGEAYVPPVVVQPEDVEDYLWNTTEYNVALGAAVTSNATYDDAKYPAANLTNGGTGGFWVMTEPPVGEEAYVDVDFGSVKTIRAMRVALRMGDAKPICVPNTIEYSYYNGSEWVSLGKGVAEGATEMISGTLVLPEDVQTQKLRLTFPDGNDGSGVCLAELYVLDSSTRTVPAHHLPTIALVSGSENGAGVRDWNVIRWTETANTIAINFADVGEGNVSTVKVNGEDYVSGTDIVIIEACEIEVVVRTERANYFDCVQKFTVKAGEAYTPVVMPTDVQNQAGGKTAVGSSTYNDKEFYSAQVLTDGGFSNRWVPIEEDKTQTWAYVALNDTISVSGARVSMVVSSGVYEWVPNAVKFEYAMDLNGEWKELGTVKSAFANGEAFVAEADRWLSVVVDEPVEAKYVRITFPEGAATSPSLTELQVFGTEVITPDATAPTVTLAGTATVEGWNVTEWSDDANTVKVNVVDAEGFTSTITVNGEAYVSGSDITLTAEGTIEVVVTTSAEGYNTVTNTYTITVPAKTEPEVPQVIGSEVYTIADGFIRKIEVGTTVNELLGNVTPAGGDIKVYKSETAATAMRGTVAVGTGNVVKLFDADGNVVDSLTVVILGDVSGDGKINATDLISLVAYIGGSREYTEAQTIAANLMQPARPTINAQDLGYLKDAINGSKTIVQK